MSHSFTFILFSKGHTSHHMSYCPTLLLVRSGRRPEDWLEDEVGGETGGQVHFLQEGNFFRPSSSGSGNIGDRGGGVRLHSSSRDESDSRYSRLSSQLRLHRQQQPIFGSAQGPGETGGERRASLTGKALDLGSSALQLLSLYIHIKEENLINNLVYSTEQFSKEPFHISIKDKFLFILINLWTFIFYQRCF